MLRWIFLLALVPAALAPAETIVCFGDSLTQGVGAPPGSSYPDFLRKDLLRDGFHATVLNEGVNGETSGDGLKRLDKVLAEHPDIVVLELGANDAVYRLPVDGAVRNLRTTMDRLQAAHVRVVLAGLILPPRLFPDEYRAQFNPMYPALAAQYGVPLIPQLLDGVAGDATLLSQDYIHPNAQGYEHVAQTVSTEVEPLLRK